MNALQRLVDARAMERLNARDATLFADGSGNMGEVADRLGWLGLTDRADVLTPPLAELATRLTKEGVTDVVLLGMGGSSLAPLVLARVFGQPSGMPLLRVLDTTSPTQVTAALGELDAEHTVVIVASKSGTTIEPLSLYAVFRTWMDDAIGRERAGRRFYAITDPGTELETLAQRDGFAQVWSASADVGGRFSALSVFGLVPAALAGVDLDGLLVQARRMEAACRTVAEDTNPAAQLAAFIVDACEAGRDKLTFVASQSLAPFGLWVEQLIAESTGKDGKGVIPVLEYAPVPPNSYGDDRAVVVLRERGDEDLLAWASTLPEGTPLLECHADSPAALGAEFVRWEYATALVGHLLGIAPFNQPNVAEAKAATNAILDGSATEAPHAQAAVGDAMLTYAGALAGIAPVTAPDTLSDALAPVLDALLPRDYLALLAYLPEDDGVIDGLASALSTIAAGTGNACVLQLGPRYLHSTGQLHKGGPDEGVFIVLTTRDAADVVIPGTSFTLRELNRAQAEGDLATLAAHGRRVVRVDLTNESAEELATFSDALADAACRCKTR